MTTPWAAQRGSAIVEYLGVVVVLLIPLIVAAVAAVRIQAASFAATSAAREAVRLVVAAGASEQGMVRAEAAVELAFADQGLAPGKLSWQCVPVSCDEAGARIEAIVRTTGAGVIPIEARAVGLMPRFGVGG